MERKFIIVWWSCSQQWFREVPWVPSPVTRKLPRRHTNFQSFVSLLARLSKELCIANLLKNDINLGMKFEVMTDSRENRDFSHIRKGLKSLALSISERKLPH